MQNARFPVFESVEKRCSPNIITVHHNMQEFVLIFLKFIEFIKIFTLLLSKFSQFENTRKNRVFRWDFVMLL